MVGREKGFSDKELTAALEELFAEGEAGARAREQLAFDLAAGPSKDLIVLFGAGHFGRKTLSGLRKLGIAPIAFIDNDARLWNSSVEGVEVLSPEEGARRHGGKATLPDGSVADNAAMTKSGETAATILRWYLWMHILAGWTITPLLFAGLAGLLRND